MGHHQLVNYIPHICPLYFQYVLIEFSHYTLQYLTSSPLDLQGSVPPNEQYRAFHPAAAGRKVGSRRSSREIQPWNTPVDWSFYRDLTWFNHQIYGNMICYIYIIYIYIIADKLRLIGYEKLSYLVFGDYELTHNRETSQPTSIKRWDMAILIGFPCMGSLTCGNGLTTTLVSLRTWHLHILCKLWGGQHIKTWGPTNIICYHLLICLNTMMVKNGLSHPPVIPRSLTTPILPETCFTTLRYAWRDMALKDDALREVL